MEAIKILGGNIKQDINNMPRKSLDISFTTDEKRDLTFFNIDEEETNETLKALRQSYVTNNYKEETILNLQSSLKNDPDTTSKELKIESYRKYNNALDLAAKNYITSAEAMIEKALEINPKDVDILNLKGLLKLLKCDFSKSFESFYTGLCYGNNEISRKYVDMLSSDEWKVFLSRYNHAIRFINEELNHESIHILDNIIAEDPDLIEPYVILSLIYDKLGNVKKSENYLGRLREMDKDNPIFDKKEPEKQKEEIAKTSPKNSKKNIIQYSIIGCLVIGLGVFYLQSTKKIENLNSELNKKEQKLDAADKELDEKEQKLNETSKELDKAKNEEKTTEVLVSDEVTLYNNAIKFKKNNDYEKAIEHFKYVISNGKSKKYISESIYQVALLNEKSKNKEEAIKYYKKYINTYTTKDQYYDDAYYQLGMIYYNDGDLENAKQTFYNLRAEDPDSMYNNSKVKEILKEK